MVQWCGSLVRRYDARLLIVGLAPGLQGAHRTGRPFTGDYAGDLLYATLAKFGWSSGTYRADPTDGLQLDGCMITNAVRCVPPQNKPTGVEITQCRPFLSGVWRRWQISRSFWLSARLPMTASSCSGLKLKDAPFGHGAVADIGHDRVLIDSYHCSRYNTNTGRLTTDMFEGVFEQVARELGR